MGFFSNITKHFSKGSGNESTKRIQKRLKMNGIDLTEEQIDHIITSNREYNQIHNIASFVSDDEIVMRTAINSGFQLTQPLEGYAQEICSIFSEKINSFDDVEPTIRDIGKRINDNEKQKLVAFRAQKLCKDAERNGNMYAREFSIRLLEYAWDGIGGWMK
jgi:hypothetical protein